MYWPLSSTLGFVHCWLNSLQNGNEQIPNLITEHKYLKLEQVTAVVLDYTPTISPCPICCVELAAIRHLLNMHLLLVKDTTWTSNQCFKTVLFHRGRSESVF